MNFCIHIFDVFLCISRFIGNLEFPPRMVLRRFLRILSYFNTFLSNVNIFVVVVEIKLNKIRFVAKLLLAEGTQAEPHTLEYLVGHRSQKFWLSRDCPYVCASVRASALEVPYLEK